MAILDNPELMFPQLQLAGAGWDQPARHPFHARLAAAARQGVTCIGLNVEEADKQLAEHSPEELRKIIADHGLRVAEVEVLFGWDHSDEATELETHVFEIAVATGATKVKAAGITPPGSEPIATEILTERFGAMCDRAARHGLTIALETIAAFPGFDLAVAADVLIGSNRPNGTLQVDTWHLFRDPTGRAALDRLEAWQIGGLELADGAAEAPADLMTECVTARMLPGEGGFPLAELLHDLHDRGVDLPISVEVLSSELQPLDVEDIAARTVVAMQKVIAAARG
jgi:sugar phosphate isomerase/epimerase